MAGKWEGFSEEDINKVLENNEGGEKPRNTLSDLSPTSIKVANLQRKNPVRERIFLTSKQIAHDNAPNIPPGAKLSVVEDKEELPLMATSGSNTDSSGGNTPSKTPVTNGAVCLKIKEDNGYEVVETDKDTVSPATLQMLIARQKMLEEQNKKRKELLAKALADSVWSASLELQPWTVCVGAREPSGSERSVLHRGLSKYASEGDLQFYVGSEPRDS